tara:strand:- start:49 stop:330 length:282 start_codon:yes stop_codon:yes gene_type:complete
MMTRRNKVKIAADGTITQSTYDVDWETVRAERDGLLLSTDLWMLVDKFNSLTTEQQNKISRFRELLRNLPTDYSTANEAYDNMPAYEEWMLVV